MHDGGVRERSGHHVDTLGEPRQRTVGVEVATGEIPARIEPLPVAGEDRVQRALVAARDRAGSHELECPRAHPRVAPMGERDYENAGIEVGKVGGEPEFLPGQAP